MYLKRWSRLCTAGKKTGEEMVKAYLFKFLADECECLENGICRSCDCNNAFWARSIGDVDFGTRLQA
jgi:hypothetical protein